MVPGAAGGGGMQLETKTNLQFINIYIYDCFLSDFFFFLLTHVNSQILLH